jgi:hypothetical protein
MSAALNRTQTNHGRANSNCVLFVFESHLRFFVQRRMARGTRTVLASGFLALVLITGSAAHSAADDCLAKPNGPTPQGQHWYYRIDHANNGRQCWYLRAETGPVQKKSRQTEPNSSKAMAQAIPAPTRPTAPAAETPLKENTAPAAAPIPWLNVQRLPEPIPLVQPVTQQSRQRRRCRRRCRRIRQRGAGSDRSSRRPNRCERKQRSSRRIATSRSVGGKPPRAAGPAIANIDHTFALLMIMFASLAIAGPACTFSSNAAGAGRQLPAAAMGARGRPERADTAHSRDAAAVRRETVRAYADQAA